MSTKITRRRAKAVLAVPAIFLGSTWLAPAGAQEPADEPAAVAGASVEAAALGEPAGAALDWLEAELDANGGLMPSPFGAGSDYGLTIDALLALVAGDRGGSETTVVSTGLVLDQAEENYYTGASFGFPDELFAGPMGKALLLAEIQDEPAADLETSVRSLMQPSGDQAGRFSDQGEFGDFSNGFGQSLTVLALARTDGGVPAAAIAFLLDQQCPSGAFRLFYAADAASAVGCDTDDEANTDATALATSALRALPSTPATDAAVESALDWLVGEQQANGAFQGAPPTDVDNSGTTGLAGAALRAAGRTAAADAAQAWVESVQLTETDPQASAAAADAGTIAYNDGARDDAVANGIPDQSRDQFRRATSQAVLAFGLEGYDTAGGHTRDVLVPSVSISDTNPDPGETITVTAGGFLGDELVDGTLHSDPVALGSKLASNGSVTFDVAIPAGFDPGSHQVAMVGQVSGTVVTADIVVKSTAQVTSTTSTTLPGTTTTTVAVASSATLPHTGAGASGPLQVAGLLFVLGGGLLIAGERRSAYRRR